MFVVQLGNINVFFLNAAWGVPPYHWTMGNQACVTNATLSFLALSWAWCLVPTDPNNLLLVNHVITYVPGPWWSGSWTTVIHKKTQNMLSEWYAWKNESATALVSVLLSLCSFSTLDTKAEVERKCLWWVRTFWWRLIMLYCCNNNSVYSPLAFVLSCIFHLQVNWLSADRSTVLSDEQQLRCGPCASHKHAVTRDIFSNKSSWQSEFWSWVFGVLFWFGLPMQRH